MADFSPAIREFLAAPTDARRLGPYRCKELLDKAGSAPVFKAVEEHAGLGLREVALKVFDIGKTKDADGWQERVVAEARTLCRVQHPNVIRFHTLTTDPRRGLMGLVMEFAAGISLDRELAELPPGDAKRVPLAVEVGISIASALAAAHEAKVVHCNVKPSNVMRTDGTHKLINFGIAASLRHTIFPGERAGLALEDLSPDSIGRKASTLDKSGESDAPITGTIGYIDPICLRTMTPPSSTSDLYSLGATLYQCIAGDVPALATAKKRGEKAVDAKVLLGDAPAAPLAEVAPSTPAALAKLVDALVSSTREGRPRSADVVVRSLERIRSALAGRERALPSEERGPFPGLDRYEASDRDVFFGRSAEIAGVIELARTRGLVGIVGLSGTGKSSITRAGVVPAIEEGALGGWPSRYRSVLVTPGSDLRGALYGALSKLLGAPLGDHPEAIAEQLAANVDAKGEGIVILVDQLEEIVTLHDAKRDQDRLDALDLLARLADAPAGLRVIVAARRDLLDGVLAVDPNFSRALSRGMQPIGPLSAAGWEEVLDQSLEAFGYAFEDEALRRDVLADIETRESAMPLVQFGLTRLWAARDPKKKTLPRSAFNAKEGMGSALSEHAAAAVADPKIPKETLRDVILAMTTPEGARAHVRQKVLVERFGDPAKQVVRALMSARLVSEEKEGVTFVHDSILREWGLVRGWIAEARDDRQLLAHLERDAARWSESRDVAELWRKGRLAAAIELWKSGRVKLGDDAQAFLTRSFREEQKSQYAFWGLVLLVVALIVGGSLFYARESSARAAQARSDADALAAALAEVKTLKQQAEENAGEAAATAKLLADLQKKASDERAANVEATLKKVASATSLDNAQKAAADLKGLTGSQNQLVPLPMDLTGGPSVPKLDTGGPGPSAGAGTFDQGAVERVINSRKAGVKRTCLDRGGNTAASTKVTASLTIAPSGQVQSVTTSGDNPTVAKCIEQQLRTWSFPPPGEVKHVQIPFVFVRQ
ncbi:MAG: AgmX/PglI C-terminal domain-containing protein [Labilithrix sp.]|nr:AgmX/PglI C-terminal domain-containing protein [Labilithrix sp.]